MTRRRRRPNREALLSDQGLLAVSAGATGLPTHEAARHLRDLVVAHMAWTHSRRARFRAWASTFKGASLALTASSTVILGLQDLTPWASVAFSMVALVTVLNAAEPFFNWRSRWILMEEAQYRLQRLRDELDYYLLTNEPEKMRKDDLDRFFTEGQTIWRDISRRWLEFRKMAGTDAS
jgi:hypothetical protein